MKKSDIHPLPEYFDRYIQLVDDVDLDTAFQISRDELAAFDWAACAQLGQRTYAPGKWTIPDVLQHLLDWERILTYRALLFARETGMQAQGIEQDVLATSAAALARPAEHLVAEMTLLRPATRLFFSSLDTAALLRTGVSWRSEMSVLALGFTIVGHQRHHLAILRERYLPLVG